MPRRVPLVGYLNFALRETINRIKESKLDFSKNRSSQWIKELAEVRSNFEHQVVENAKKFQKPSIHPARLARDLVPVLDKNCTVVIDSFTLRDG